MSYNIFDYKNPQIGILCNKKLDRYNRLANDLNMKFQGAIDLIENTIQTLLDNIQNYNYKERKYPAVSEMIKNTLQYTNPQSIQIPGCLDNKDEFSNIIKSTSEQLYDIIKKKNNYSTIIDEVIKIIQNNKSKMNNINDIKELELSKGIFRAEKAFNLVLDSVTYTIFKSFDILKDYFEKVNIHENLKEMNNISECLEINCSNSEEKVDISNLFTENKVLKLPIDMFSGEFRPYRLFLVTDKLDQFRDILALLDKDYLSYCSRKEIEMNKIKEIITGEIND